MSTISAFERAGFTVAQHTQWHWTLRGRGLHVDFWPSKNKFQVFGKVFCTSVQDFIQAARAGHYTKPDEQPSKCTRCGAPIYWVKTHNGKWMPLDSDGGSHFSRCKRTQ